jgi:hypothetical protein
MLAGRAIAEVNGSRRLGETVLNVAVREIAAAPAV